MKNNHLRKYAFSLIVTAGVALSSLAFGQEVVIEVDDPEFQGLSSPEISVGGASKRFKPKEWLEVEVKFNVEAARGVKAPADGYYDDVTIKWYVATENSEAKNYILLSKEVKHVNIPVGEDMFSSVYLSPSGVERLSGSDSVGSGTIKYIGGEISYKGRPLARFTNEKTKGWPKTPWWTFPSLVPSTKIPLYNKNETPFRNLWWDRYAEIESERR